ncbi:MAG: helix-turn-helix domain-containing protein [Acidimicrobiia bacterium]
MATRESDILLHPVRLRIVLASANDEVTTAELAERLPDIAPATLYRHVAVLADAGMLEVVRERQARGATERTFRVNSAAAHLGEDEAKHLSADEHLAAFTMFTGALIESYGRYLASADTHPHLDGVSFRQVALHLTDEELAAMVQELREVLSRYTGVPKSEERRRRSLTTIILPE